MLEEVHLNIPRRRRSTEADCTITDADAALKSRCFQKSARPTHVKVDLADRNFDGPFRFTFPTIWGPVAVSSWKAEVPRSVVHEYRLRISFPAYQRFLDRSVSAAVLMLAVHFPFLNKPDVFFTKHDVLYIRNLK